MPVAGNHGLDRPPSGILQATDELIMTGGIMLELGHLAAQLVSFGGGFEHAEHMPPPAIHQESANAEDSERPETLRQLDGREHRTGDCEQDEEARILAPAAAAAATSDPGLISAPI